MQPGLMRKGRGANIGCGPQRDTVEHIIQHPADPGQAGQCRRGDPGLEAAGIGLFQQQGRDQRGQVGIAATLAQPVQRALDLARPRIHGSQRIGHGIAGIVMAVNAQPVTGYSGRHHLGGDAPHLGRQGATIGVTEHHPARALIQGRTQAGQGIGGIGAIAVEEMLGIQDCLAPLCPQMGERGADRLQVLVQRHAQGGGHMELMRLAYQTDGRGAGIQHGGQDIIILSRSPDPLGHPEGGHHGTGPGDLGKEIAVGRVRPRPAAFDVIDPQPIQRRRDLDLLGGGELHPLRLLAIAERGVEKEKAFAGHSGFP